MYYVILFIYLNINWFIILNIILFISFNVIYYNFIFII